MQYLVDNIFDVMLDMARLGHRRQEGNMAKSSRAHEGNEVL